MSFISRPLATLLVASVLTAGVALLPIAPFGVHPAWPHGGGGGGGGNGNGNGGGHGNGGGAASGSVGSGVSASAGTNVDLGHKGSTSKGGKGSTGKGLAGSKDPKGKGSTASALGALNAAHASPNALARASANSRVGKIAAYKDAINNLNAVNAAFKAGTATIAQQEAAQMAAAQALANAANKSISTGVVNSVDALLGVSLSAPTTAADLAAQAAALQ